MFINNYLVVIIRLVVAFALGGLVGYQREKAERPAGFRTHVLVALGAAVFTLISIAPFAGSRGMADPSRIASQVVVGIGFIGAGAIIQQGDIIMGLTTAASLWVTAAIGVAAGGGYYILAGISTVLVYLTLEVFKLIEKKVAPSVEHGVLYVLIKNGRNQLNEIEKLLEETEIRSKNFELSKEKGLSEYRFYVELPAAISTEDLITDALKIEGVQKARWEGVLTGRAL